MAPPPDGATRTKSEVLDEASASVADPSADTALAGASGGERSADDDRSGEILGRFRLVEKIGEGGMGVVYSAEDQRLGRTVALKILPREAVGREDRRRRFLREARAASAVLHPNIATIFEVGEHGGEVFLAMEHVAGETLRRALSREGALPIRRALTIALDVAKGLAKAHAASIVHRDLKPENVMIARDGEVKILDFGLAKRVSEGEPGAGEPVDLATIEGQILGTVGYMSPEQALGAAVDLRTDVFSLGVVLYEMLTGTRPFAGETRMATLVATQRDPAAPPSFRRPDVPAAVDALVLRCLEKRPEDRFPGAGEVEKALAEVLRGGDDSFREGQSETGGRRESPRPSAEPSRGDEGAPGARGEASRRRVGFAAAVLLGLAATGLWIRGGLSGDAGAPASVTTGTLTPGTTGMLGSTGTLAPGTTGTLDSTGTVAPAAATRTVAAPRRPCLSEDAGKKACSNADSIAWCDPEGRAVGCCGKGLVPKGADGICVCPPGGTAVPQARARGCDAVAPDFDERFMAAKRGAMERAIACFQPERGRSSISGGTFEAEFYLTPEGEVIGARVGRATTPDDEGQACAVAALRATRFPPPPGEEAGKKLGFGFVFKD